MVPSAIGYFLTRLPVAIFLTINSIGIISSFFATMTLGSGRSMNWVGMPFSSKTLKILAEITALYEPFLFMTSFLAPSPAVISSLNSIMTSFSLSVVYTLFTLPPLINSFLFMISNKYLNYYTISFDWDII